MTGKEFQKIVLGSAYTKREWVKKSGVSEKTIGNLYHKPVILARYIKIFKEAGLLTDEGNVSKSKEILNVKQIPYYEDLNASAGLSTILNNSQIQPSSYMEIPNCGADFFINIFGDSMYPKYCSGERVGLKEIEKQYVMFGHAYVVELKNGECYIKYIRPGKDEDHWILASENELYHEREFHLDKLNKVYMIKIVLTKTTI